MHSLQLKDLPPEINTSAAGLTKEEAIRRLKIYGLNSITIKKEISPLAIFLNQFKNALVLILLFAALISFAINAIDPKRADIFDAVLILLIVIANAIFGFIQEYNAEKSIEALTKMAAPRATVIRDAMEIEISSEEVVPGDILVVKEGDKIAADARLLEGYSLYADESMLSGESMPVAKKAGVLPEKTPLAERTNLLYMNTVITRGRATAVVYQTGLHTEVGAIAKAIAESPEKVTLFHKEIEDLGKKVSIITILILLLIIITNLALTKADLLSIFIAAVALGVAAIPEGLPAVVTLSLSIATKRMLKQNALMRRLSTVQELGSVDVICTDKTGTLTENSMTVTQIYIPDFYISVSGKGQSIEGKFDIKNEHIDFLLTCAGLCNDVKNSVFGKFKGDPTEIAILIPLYKAKINIEQLRSKFPRLSEISFSSERKMMSTVNTDGKTNYSFVKGAPEIIISKCSKILVNGKIKKLSDQDRLLLLKRTFEMASRALRTLAFAYKENPLSFEETDVESDLIFLGLMGMIDPPRDGVKEAIADCRNAGIRLIMISGDNVHTATAIGRELGFNGQSINCDELDGMPENKLRKIVEEVDLYARSTPKHKVIILKALQANNHIVCMSGDGINDAPAVKNADVGISMGIRGTQVTQQASDIIVLDDNFITIKNAIKEGRNTFDNIRKFVVYLLGANISEVLVIFISSVTFLGLSSKIAIQLLWINLVTDGLPALALGIDPPAHDLMKRLPRPKNEKIINGGNLYFIISIGLCATISLLALYAHMLSLNDSVKAYSVLFTSFVVLEMLTVYVVRWKYHTKFFSNKWLGLAVASSIILQLMLIYTPLGSLFGMVSLSLIDWTKIAIALVIYLVLLFIAINLKPFIMKRAIQEANP